MNLRSRKQQQRLSMFEKVLNKASKHRREGLLTVDSPRGQYSCLGTHDISC
jgi:hypothetical protein